MSPAGIRGGRLGVFDVVRLLGWRYWAAAGVASIGTAVLIGIPTDVLPNPWFTRMTPVRPLDYVFWPSTSLLVGMLLASYLLPAGALGQAGRRVGFGSGLLGWLAIGCPICNKLIVGLLGVSGALQYFGRLQPLLGFAGVVLAAGALAVRLRSFARGCRIDTVATRLDAAASA